MSFADAVCKLEQDQYKATVNSHCRSEKTADMKVKIKTKKVGITLVIHNTSVVKSLHMHFIEKIA